MFRELSTDKTFVLPCFEITVVVQDGGGCVTSALHEVNAPSEYEAGIDAIESLILAHACAGVDVASGAYIEGVETAVNAVANYF